MLFVRPLLAAHHHDQSRWWARPHKEESCANSNPTRVTKHRTGGQRNKCRYGYVYIILRCGFFSCFFLSLFFAFVFLFLFGDDENNTRHAHCTSVGPTRQGSTKLTKSPSTP